jgi:hypothetical protein
MASDLQVKLFHSNKDIKHLSSLMANYVYPRLLFYMQKLGMEEVRFDGDFNDWKTFSITLTGKIQFFIEDEAGLKKDIYELDFLGEKDCPLFFRDTVEDKIKTYETPLSKYMAYCYVVLEKLEELQSFLNELENIINRIESFGIFFERKVIFEKINKQINYE